MLVLLSGYGNVSQAAEPPVQPPVTRILTALRDPVSTQILIAAHRGGYASDKSDGAPENSVANIDVAFRKGFDRYETDIRRTKDGVFVIVHDDTLDRETTGTGPVEALDWSEVAQLKKRYRDGAVSDQPVARLEDLLKAGKGKILFKADLKPGVIDHFETLARLIAAHNMADHVILRARWKDAPAIDQAFRDGAPWVSVMFQVDTADQVRKAIETFGVRDHFTNGEGQGTLQESRGIETIQINIAKGETLTNNPNKLEAIQTARDSGLLVETHNYNDPVLWDQLIDAGVRMFHTTAPEETLTHLRSRGLHW